MSAASLSALMVHTDPVITEYFQYHHPEFTLAASKQVFTDYCAWLWLKVEREKQDKKTHLFGPLLVLDQMWHVFILHTQKYHAFCTHFFGEYIHHHVEPPGEEHEVLPAELADFLEDCFTYLGDAWVERYFSV